MKKRKRYSVSANYTLEWLANKGERIKFIRTFSTWYELKQPRMMGSENDGKVVVEWEFNGILF